MLALNAPNENHCPFPTFYPIYKLFSSISIPISEPILSISRGGYKVQSVRRCNNDEWFLFVVTCGFHVHSKRADAIIE